jgi:trans-2,3-dihydro-3-hydroxyanthranilate isomerase
VFLLNSPIFYIVDVFTPKKYSGNQLAVIILSKTISNKKMQQIAQEMNFSETTFLLNDNDQDNSFDVRIFTPKTEIPFAGHPTLGTAYVIKEEIIRKPIKEIFLNLKAGKIPITFESNEKNSVLWMKQLDPIFGETYDSSKISKILGIRKNEVDERFPIQNVSTGLPTIIVPLKALKTVKKVKVNTNEYLDFTENIIAKTFLIFCSETYDQENDLNVRFFAGHYGIPEDPATGSANGCLAAYLIKNNYYSNEKIDLKVEQGMEIDRPSLIRIRAHKKNNKIDIYVGGEVKIIAKGKLV